MAGTGVSISEEAKQLADKLVRHFRGKRNSVGRVSRSSVVDLAIRQLAEREGVGTEVEEE